MIAPEDVIPASASPQSVPMPGGRPLQPPPEIDALLGRIATVLRQDGEELIADNLLLQYDVFHMQIVEGDLARTIERLLPRIGHIQIADNPGRHEPGTGEINYEFLFEFIDKIGYSGWIGCEYKPLTTTDAGLSWVKKYLEHKPI